MSAKHSDQRVNDGIHIAHSFEYADTAARQGASGLVAGDIGKLALQLDDNTLWLLTGVGPVVWKQQTGVTKEEHKYLQIADGIHLPYSFEYADAAARVAAGGFVAQDVGKWARQLNDNSIWMLVSIGPASWFEITSIGSLPDQNKIDILCVKATPGTINAGQLVRIAGYDLGLNAVQVELAKADSQSTMPALGVAADTIDDTVAGRVRIIGVVSGIDTSSYAIGSQLHVSSTTAGGVTDEELGAPNLHQVVGHVVEVAVNGKVFFNITLQDFNIARVVTVGTNDDSDAVDYEDVNDAILALSLLDPPPSIANPATLRILPGVYTMDPDSIPSGVHLSGAGAYVCSLVSTNPAVDFLTLGDGCSVDGISIEGANGAGSAGIRLSGAKEASVTNCFFFDCRWCMRADSGAVLYADNVLARKADVGDVIDRVISVESGSTLNSTNLKSVGLPGSPIGRTVYVTGVGTLALVESVATNYTDEALFADDGAEVNLFTGEVRNAVNAVRLGNGGAKPTVGVDGLVIRDSSALDFLVEHATAQLRIVGVTFDATKLSAPVTAVVIGTGFSTFGGDEAVRVFGELHVGSVSRPRESVFGEGESTTVGMVVQSNSNGEIGTWVDHTAAAASASGSTFPMHQGVGANQCFYVGGDFQFNGLELNSTIAAAVGAGAYVTEYWDGGSWVAFDAMAVNSDAFPYEQYANVLLGRAQGEQIHFQTLTGWATKTLNGSTKYWVRIRITVGITTVQTLEQVKLGTDRTEIKPDGFLHHYGIAQPRRPLLSHLALTRNLQGFSPANNNSFFSPDIKLNAVGNQFSDGARDATGIVIYVPEGMNTARNVEFEVYWYQSNAANTGNVELILRRSIAKVGDPLNGTLAQVSLSDITNITVGAQYQIRKTTFQFRVPTLVPGNVLALMLERDARPSNANDTLSGHIAVVAIRATARFWS